MLTEETILPNLSKSTECQMQQGNGLYRFVKYAVQWLFHLIKKHFVAGRYLMLSFPTDVLSVSNSALHSDVISWRLNVFTETSKKIFFFLKSFHAPQFTFLSLTSIVTCICNKPLNSPSSFHFTFKLSIKHTICSMKLV